MVYPAVSNLNCKIDSRRIQTGAKWADIIIVAPCSAETISRLSHGRADDLLGAIILASKAEKFIAPAMNINMWSNEITQQNIDNT